MRGGDGAAECGWSASGGPARGAGSRNGRFVDPTYQLRGHERDRPPGRRGLLARGPGGCQLDLGAAERALAAGARAWLLRSGRIELTPGLDFGRQGAGFARLNIGTSAALLTEAVDRMAKATNAPPP